MRLCCNQLCPDRRYGLGRRVALDVARGLHHLHRRRILHFDIKVRTRANCDGALLCVSMLCACTTPAFHISKSEWAPVLVRVKG